mgnify:CR=1 FL=1
MAIRAWRWLAVLAILFAVAVPKSASAGQASVLDATVRANPGGTYAFSATIFHKDEGWKHYADAFEILNSNGVVLGTRILYHPHVDEQPFTRSLSKVEIPIGVNQVKVRAKCKIHGPGKRVVTLTLPPRR